MILNIEMVSSIYDLILTVQFRINHLFEHRQIVSVIVND